MFNNMLNQLLRNREELFAKIFSGKDVMKIIGSLLLICLIFFGIFGIVMGAYNSVLQTITSMVKVPLLFLLTLLICYPALFMFNVLLGSKLNLAQSLAMILTAFAIIACVMVSFAPMSLFFLIIGWSYSFIRLLQVAIFTIAGIAGMIVLSNGFTLACEKYEIYPKMGIRIFRVWVIIFAFVGSQLAWNLRPFVGTRDRPFSLFREQESNFYSAVFHASRDIFYGKQENENNQGKSELEGETPDSIIRGEHTYYRTKPIIAEPKLDTSSYLEDSTQ